MKFLLDTCFLSELRRPRPNQGVIDWLSSQDEGTFIISVITLGEFEKGIHKLADEGQRKVIVDWFTGPFTDRFGSRIVTFDTRSARRWGRLIGTSERAGVVLPVIDAMLTATALEFDAVVVTRNASDFQTCGARVLNPWIT